MAAKELDLYRRLGEATGADIVLEIVTPGGMDPAAELMPLAEAAAAAPACGPRRSRSSRRRT